MRSPGIWLGIVAVVLALTGTAVAGHLITGRDIQNNTITGADIRSGTIKRSDLSRNLYRALSDTTTTQGTQGPAGPQGLQGERGETGAQGERGLQGPSGESTVATTIPAGQLVKGAFSFRGTSTGTNQREINLPMVAPTDLDAGHVRTVNPFTMTTSSDCGGTHDNPDPASGFLCLYVFDQTGVIGSTVAVPAVAASMTRHGFVVEWVADITGPGSSHAVWAYKAP